MILRLALALALAVAVVVRADLPSHCLKWQVLGVWDFKISDVQEGYPLCGHTRPDDMVSVYVNKLGFDNPGFTVTKTGYFTLYSNFSDEAQLCLEGACEDAKWTMVYDEGMSIKGSNSGMEIFVQYVYVPAVTPPGRPYPSPKQASYWKTFCDRTYPGWFSTSRTSRGCAVAKNRVERSSQPSVSLMANEPGDSLLQIRSGIKMALQQSFRHEFMSKRAFDFSKLDEQVSLINKRQKFWIADASAASFARDYTNRDMFSSIGGIKEKLLKPKSFSLDSILDPVAREKERTRRTCIRKVLPSEWDWSRNDSIAKTPVIDQGSCGSCYAVSSSDAFTARLRLKKQSPNFSVRSPTAILACSPTNQGCDGGFPWLVAQHAHYEGLYSEECTGPYSTKPPPSPDSSVMRCDFSAQACTSDHEFARAWGYVGGYYGRGNTEDMMWSLFRDGPMVVAINAQDDLFVYKSGLFVSTPSSPNDQASIAEANWEATTHAVALVGYGLVNVEGDDVESWKIKNSWGVGWGEQGYVNIQRGVDAMAVESMAVHAIFGDGKPGNPGFEAHIRQRLNELNDAECTQAIEAMLAKELV